MALELLRFGVWCLYKKVQRSMFEHVCVCVCVCVPVLAIYQMSSAKVIWHDMDWTSGWHSRATCFFFCQVWILAKSLYFLSHCIRQTENIDKDLKEKNKKRCYCSFTSHSFEFGLVSGRRSGLWGGDLGHFTKKSSPGAGKRWQVCMLQEGCGFEQGFSCLGRWAIKKCWPWEDCSLLSLIALLEI